MNLLVSSVILARMVGPWWFPYVFGPILVLCGVASLIFSHVRPDEIKDMTVKGFRRNAVIMIVGGIVTVVGSLLASMH